MRWNLCGRISSLAIQIWVVTIFRTLAYIYCSLFKFRVNLIKKYWIVGREEKNNCLTVHQKHLFDSFPNSLYARKIITVLTPKSGTGMIIKQMCSYLSLRFDNFTYKSMCLCNNSGSNLHHLCWFKSLFGTCAASSTGAILLSHSQLGMLFCGIVLSPFILYLPQGKLIWIDIIFF